MLEEGESSRCEKTQLRKIVTSLLENPRPGELEQDGEEAKLLEFLRARSCFVFFTQKDIDLHGGRFLGACLRCVL